MHVVIVIEVGEERRLRWSLVERLDAIEEASEDGGDGVDGGVCRCVSMWRGIRRG